MCCWDCRVGHQLNPIPDPQCTTTSCIWSSHFFVLFSISTPKSCSEYQTVSPWLLRKMNGNGYGFGKQWNIDREISQLHSRSDLRTFYGVFIALWIWVTFTFLCNHCSLTAMKSWVCFREYQRMDGETNLTSAAILHKDASFKHLGSAFNPYNIGLSWSISFLCLFSLCWVHSVWGLVAGFTGAVHTLRPSAALLATFTLAFVFQEDF